MADSSDTSASKKGGLGRPFAAGVSGNPGGKSPEREALRRYIVEAYGKEAIDGIAEMSRSARSEKVKLDAKVWIAEQVVGRAVVAISGEDGGPLKVDVGDGIRALLARLGASVGHE